jgi:putative Mn2+ efflux pump MntP
MPPGMNLITIIVIAVGLAMDTFAVSIATGSASKQVRVTRALQMALFFGGFQLVMPLIGSLAGLAFKKYIAGYDHWVAFGLLAAVGGKMIHESFKIKTARKNFDFSNIFVLLILSIATSIDALAVGITLSLITSSIGTAVIIIGLITFAMSYMGVLIGQKLGHFFENKFEAIGGLVLIGISLKIVLQHLL